MSQNFSNDEIDAIKLFGQYRSNLIPYLLSQERINRHRVINILSAIYSLIGQETPEILFAQSPRDGYKLAKSVTIRPCLHKELYLRADYMLLTQKQINYESNYENLVWKLLTWSVLEDQDFKVDWLIGCDLELLDDGSFGDNMDWRSWQSQVTGLGYTILQPPIVTPSTLVNAICRVLVYRQLGASIDAFTALFITWLFRLMQNVGWLFPYQDVCIVCDRPTKLNLEIINPEYKDSSLNKPIIEFVDGYRIFPKI